LALQAEQRPISDAFSVRVNKVSREADDILSFELVDPQGGTLPPFTAGAHIEVNVRNDLKRQYSLCNDPVERDRYLIAVLKEAHGRGSSVAMHDVKPGDVLTVSTPRNQFPLAGPEASFHLLLAGGIGVTPMMAMLAELNARDVDYRMHYCTRAPERAAFLDRLEPLIAVGKVVVHYDGGDPAQGLDIAATLSRYQPGMHIYYCGPPGFMTAASEATRGWSPDTVHREYFTAAEPAGPLVNRPFKVKINNTAGCSLGPNNRRGPARQRHYRGYGLHGRVLWHLHHQVCVRRARAPRYGAERSRASQVCYDLLRAGEKPATRAGLITGRIGSHQKDLLCREGWEEERDESQRRHTQLLVRGRIGRGIPDGKAFRPCHCQAPDRDVAYPGRQRGRLRRPLLA
jgi:vanillate O-demethylase ferredoxin subunit